VAPDHVRGGHGQGQDARYRLHCRTKINADLGFIEGLNLSIHLKLQIHLMEICLQSFRLAFHH